MVSIEGVCVFQSECTCPVGPEGFAVGLLVGCCEGCCVGCLLG